MGIIILVAFLFFSQAMGAHRAQISLSFNCGVKILLADPDDMPTLYEICFTVASRLIKLNLASRLIKPATAAILALVTTVLGWPEREPSLRLVKPF